MATVPGRAAGWLATVPVVGALPASALAASPTRIDLFDLRGNRTGSAVVAGDRVDFFDARGNRTASGHLQDRGGVDLFDTRGNRTGYAIIEGDRMDLFDGRNSRTGSGRIRDSAVQTHDRQGTRSRAGRWAEGWGR
jgi:hypothetical protein